ncbi:MFS transporter [Sphingomonas sp. CGMCC 1.13654]|uniref:MFS transporter n=1 Tax=Sphingomonas chungangi TaxID=2683589 RepID=A0A838L4F2_9SPHN|nr:MFS transporter [Sphingomonas chungangi]MBA2933575.1 MFS transporter [Sphingomonas chungangi]MVW54908.1 MFS transporter [Sphingomonas chungangi]
MSTVFDYSRQLRDGGLNRRQLLVILMLGVLVLFDGMDNQLLGLIAHDMSHDLGISIERFGLVFSAALVGAIIGSLTMSALADRWLGRKRVVLIGMGLAGLCTMLTARAETLDGLVAIRLVTGAGLGAALPNLISLASEFSPRRVSRRVVSLMVAFVPLGSLLGSVLARAAEASAGWRVVLALAGGGTLALTLLAAIMVPESIYFLVRTGCDQRRAVAAVARLFADRSVTSVIVDADDVGAQRNSKQPVASLFGAPLWRLTLLFWLGFIMNQAILYFVMNWTPSLLLKSGLSSSAGLNAAAMFGIGGALGTLGQGWLATRFNIYKVMTAEIALYIAAMLLLPALLAAGVAPILIFVVAAAICAYNAGMMFLVLETYPETIKSTGYGWAFGVGRIGASGAPVLAGLALARGWNPGEVFMAAAVPGLVTGIVLLGLGRAIGERSRHAAADGDATGSIRPEAFASGRP